MATPPDFTSGAVLTAAQMNAVGLWLVKTQTVGSAVASVTVTGAFSADYDNYKIIVSGGVASTDIGLLLQMGSTTTGYYAVYIYSAYSGTSVAGFNTNNGANWAVGASSSAGHQVSIDVLNPFLAKRTSFGGFNQNTTTNAGPVTGYIANSTSYTAFTISTTSGTLTGGTIKVYGYRN
jgi:hypothetical protein